jgi:hypothetical protein
MTVTSLSAVAVSFRSASLTAGSSHSTHSVPAAAPAPADAPALPTDTVELSQPAADTATPTGIRSTRSETLLRALDANGDGLVSKEEFTDGAIELLKHASVRFHHRRVGKGDGIEKRDEKWTSRLEDVFAHVDANRDGSVEISELTSALPKSAQRPARRLPQFGADGPAAAITDAVTSVTVVVALAIKQYTLEAGQTGGREPTRIAKA